MQIIGAVGELPRVPSIERVLKMTQRKAQLYYFTEQYEIFKQGVKSQLRLYNRDYSKSHSCVAFDPEDKKVIKEHGFKWDRQNHAYYLNNPSAAAIAAITPRFTVTTYNYRAKA